MNSLTNLEELELDTLAFDPGVLWFQLRQRWWIPFVVATLVVVISFIGAKLMIKDSWEAKTILIRHNKNMSSQSDVPYLYLQIDFNTVLETILVRENLESVIKRLSLKEKPTDLYKQIKVKRGNRSDVINISATRSDRQEAVSVVNAVSDVFIESYASIQNASALKIYNYFTEELKFEKIKLGELDEKDYNFRRKHKVVSIDAQMAMNYQKIRELDIKMIDSKVKTSEIKAKYEATKEKIQHVDKKVPLETIVKSESFLHISQLRKDLHTLQRRYTDENPKVRHLMQKISIYENEQKNPKTNTDTTETVYGQNPVYLELGFELIRYELDLLVSGTALKNYKKAIDDIQANLASLNKLNRDYKFISEEVDQQRNMLLTVKSRLTEAKLALGSNTGDFDIIEKAIPPPHPKPAHRKLIALALGMLSFIICVGVLLAKAFLSKTIKTEFDVRHHLKSVCLGQIPKKEEVNEKVYYAAMQITLENIENRRIRDNNIVLVSNDGCEQDSSMLTSELIAFYVWHNKRVLHIESTENSDCMASARINDSLYHGNQEWIPLAISDHIDKAYFFCDKSIYINYINQATLHQHINTIAKDYDVLIWDMFKPHNHLQLYTAISRTASVVLFVARSFVSERKDIDKTISYLHEKGVRDVGILIDQVPASLLSY